jgi:hypothetical protein
MYIILFVVVVTIVVLFMLTGAIKIVREPERGVNLRLGRI